MGFTDRVKGWFGAAKAAPTERKVADMLASGGISGDKFPTRVDGQPFISGSTYFGLRLSGMHLVDGRRFLTQRLPLVVCLAEFQTGGEERSVPFSIGPDVVRKKLRDAGVKEEVGKPTWIELSDLTVVRPTPANDANLSLYTGLFSVPGDDLVKSLLNVVGAVGTALANPAVAPALKVTETVYDSFGALLGFNQVEQLVAALVGNALTEHGSGYLLTANVDSQAFDVKSAQVISGRLHWPANRNSGQLVTEFDHTLLALEQFKTVAEEGSGLAEALFGQAWAAVRKAGKSGFGEALEKLRDTISASNDLTEDDRLRLLGAYGAAATELADKRWGAPKTVGVRGTATGSLPSRLDGSAARLERDGEKSQIIDRLRATADQIRVPLDLPDPQQTDPEKTREGDNRAILGLAQAIEISRTIPPADARRAAMVVAHALAPQPP